MRSTPRSAVGAGVAAALHCGLSMASSYMHYAIAMHDALPAVAQVFVAGDIDFRTFPGAVQSAANHYPKAWQGHSPGAVTSPTSPRPAPDMRLSRVAG